MNKTKILDYIAQEISSCKICQKESSGKAVPGEGSADARVVFIGEAPGKEEAKTGRPFVGRSGKLLRKLIRDSGLKEKDVYITSPVKFLPDRGTPDKKQISHGRRHLKKQLAVIDPKLIVLLGNVACRGVLGKKIPVLKEHGKVHQRSGRKYLITLHPAAVIRFPKYTSIITQDFQVIRSLLRNQAVS